MADFSDDELLSELGIDLAPAKSVTYTAKEERLISGFEEIIHFYDEHKKCHLIQLMRIFLNVSTL